MCLNGEELVQRNRYPVQSLTHVHTLSSGCVGRCRQGGGAGRNDCGGS